MKTSFGPKIFTFCIWLSAFIFAVVIYSKNIEKLNLFENPKVQADIIKQMSTDWISQAQMQQRIFVKEIVLRKAANKLAAVEIDLATTESFDKNYQAKLLYFLRKKAQSETGFAYSFHLTKLY